MDTGPEFAAPDANGRLEHWRHRVGERDQLAHDRGALRSRVEPAERGELRDRQVLHQRGLVHGTHHPGEVIDEWRVAGHRGLAGLREDYPCALAERSASTYRRAASWARSETVIVRRSPTAQPHLTQARRGTGTRSPLKGTPP